MGNFDKILNKVIADSDILLIVIDARRIDYSINPDIEKKVGYAKKKFLYVINKIDLLPEAEQKKRQSLKNSIKVSATAHMNTMTLLKKINQLANGKKITVGVIGYPNTGKSTLINALKGKASAKTSLVSGYTRKKQIFKITKDIKMIDTPGVIPYSKEDQSLGNALIGAKDFNKVKDPDHIAMQMIEKLDGKIERYFDVKKSTDSYETLEKIALKKNILKKGGEPDIERMGREIIRLWQIGKII